MTSLPEQTSTAAWAASERSGEAAHASSAAACRALAVPRASYYRSLQPTALAKPRPTPARALSAEEKQSVLDQLHSARFCDKAPAEIYATLLDEGIYLCSVRTMHRILAEQVVRRQLVFPLNDN